jgi:SAM-dependent methyltransferase
MNDESDQWEKIFQQDGRVFLEPRPLILKFTDALLELGMRSVLDLGCGTGRHVVHMAQKGLHVTGLDNAPTALKLTGEWLKEKELAAGLVLSDMRNPLPFVDQSFDAVLSTQVIHHARLNTVIEIAKEIDRITRIHGRILITVPTHEAVLKDSQELIEIEPNTFVPATGTERGLPHHIFSPDEFRNIFPRFQVIDLREYGGVVIALTAEKNITN